MRVKGVGCLVYCFQTIHRGDIIKHRLLTLLLIRHLAGYSLQIFCSHMHSRKCTVKGQKSLCQLS